MLKQPNETLEGNIFYIIEHQLLRDDFYANTANFLGIRVEELYEYIKSIFEDNREEFKYKLEDFNIEYYKYDKTYAMILSFPKPEYVTLCDRIYALFNPEKNKKQYFTIERGIKEPEGFVCSWADDKHTHINHNRIESLDWEDTKKQEMINLEKHIILSIFDNDDNTYTAKTIV